MRTKKTNIKNGKITRTIPFTTVKYLSLDIETREVKEEFEVLVMDYDKQEAELALREMGKNVAAVIDVTVAEDKVEMDYKTFVKFGRYAD